MTSKVIPDPFQLFHGALGDTDLSPGVAGLAVLQLSRQGRCFPACEGAPFAGLGLLKEPRGCSWCQTQGRKMSKGREDGEDRYAELQLFSWRVAELLCQMAFSPQGTSRD